ncbi:MAG: hypothetical protein U0990_12630 [Candidatus Nanopelagicales bacterium]|nr:hypothetical protein [Candidatus Nanopelagicales bacterium]
MPAQGGYGRIRLFNDFCGPETPVAGSGAYAAATGNQIVAGDFRVVGDLAETDTGVVGLSKASGYVRISGNNEDGKGVAIATEVVFSPALNGPLAAECRLERQVLTAGNVFFGFCDTLADDVAEPLTATGTALTLTAGGICGFMLDSQLTAADGLWHMPYNGGSVAGPTVSTDVESDVTAIAAESDILRVEIDPNGTARWYINGDLQATVENAVSTTTLMAALVGCWGTASTAADVDVDYLAVEANRDWTR